MAWSEPTATERVEVLDHEERAWLAERLREYAELLNYLREH
jgi:hypothetical protein